MSTPLTPLTLFDLAQAKLLTSAAVRSSPEFFHFVSSTLSEARAQIAASEGEMAAGLQQMIDLQPALGWSNDQLASFASTCTLKGMISAVTQYLQEKELS